MSSNASVDSGSVLWTGKPWIVPAAVARAIIVVVITSVLVSIEFLTGTEGDIFAGFPVVFWTIIVFFVVWLLSLSGLIVERATNTYTLKNDSLGIQTGIVTSHSFVIVPSGFSDLEVIRGVAGRIWEYGDIVIRTQSERDSQRVLVKVKNPLKVADQIRFVMGRPIVRVDQSPAP